MKQEVDKDQADFDIIQEINKVQAVIDIAHGCNNGHVLRHSDLEKHLL